MDIYREYLKRYARIHTPKDPATGLPKRYVAGLTPEEKKEQVKEIEKTKKTYEKTGKVITRKKVSEGNRRSPHVIKFERIYGFPVTDLERVKKEFQHSDIETIFRKGIGAYGSSGSRPNQSPQSWAFARLASVLTGGKALAVDRDLIGDKDLKKIMAKNL